MKFHEYLESTYVSTNIQLQQEFSPYKQAKTLAVQKLINGQRNFLRFVSYPVLIVGYLLILARLVKAPKQAQAIIKGYQDAAAVAMKEAQSQAVSKLTVVDNAPAKPVVVIPQAGEAPYNTALQTREDAIKQQLAKQQADAANKDRK